MCWGSIYLYISFILLILYRSSVPRTYFIEELQGLDQSLVERLVCRATLFQIVVYVCIDIPLVWNFKIK